MDIKMNNPREKVGNKYQQPAYNKINPMYDAKNKVLLGFFSSLLLLIKLKKSK
jgi:hypothetical protein